MIKNNKTFGYFFLNKRLHPPVPYGFENSIILLIVNKNNSINKNKFLFVQQSNDFWNLPKEHIESKIIADDVFNTISRNLENELGFKGIKVVETKPVFKQVALLFDVATQIYDKQRSLDENIKFRPIKGKVYQLAIVQYFGPDEIPISRKSKEIRNFRWVNNKEGDKLMKYNISSFKNGRFSSKKSVDFNIGLFQKIISIYKAVEKLRDDY